MSLGTLVKSRREATLDPLTGRPYTQEGLSKALGITRSALKAIESGATESIDGPKANRLAALLDLAVEELVLAMGFAVGTGPLTSDESELVRLYRRAPEHLRPAVLAILRSGVQLSVLTQPPADDKQQAG